MFARTTINMLLAKISAFVKKFIQKKIFLEKEFKLKKKHI